jgi:hypothetical protein
VNPLFEVTTLIIYTQFHPFNAFIKSPVIAILTQRVQYLGYEAITGFRVVFISQNLFDQIEQPKSIWCQGRRIRWFHILVISSDLKYAERSWWECRLALSWQSFMARMPVVLKKIQNYIFGAKWLHRRTVQSPSDRFASNTRLFSTNFC